jgi:hypothetical protein
MIDSTMAVRSPTRVCFKSHSHSLIAAMCTVAW